MTSIPNHAGNIKDMKYALIRSIINTESLIGSSITAVSSQLDFVYSWLQLVDLVARHDMSEVYET